MNLYQCRWPNGDCTFVFALSREDAAYFLDEFEDAGAEGVTLRRVPAAKARGFMVGFVPTDEGADEDEGTAWNFDDDAMGETTFELLGSSATAMQTRRKRSERALAAAKESSKPEPSGDVH